MISRSARDGIWVCVKDGVRFSKGDAGVSYEIWKGRIGVRKISRKAGRSERREPKLGDDIATSI